MKKEVYIMATPRKTQIEKIENVLLRHTATPGITADSIAKLARVPRENVGKRVSDLREYYNIYTNYRNVDGKRTAFYRLAQ
jgi:hypothetical protein